MLTEPKTLIAEDFKIQFFSGYSICLRSDGIIQLAFEKGFHGTMEDAKTIVATFSKFKSLPKPGLLIIYDEDNTLSKEAREYIASETVCSILKADAFVINGLAMRIIGNGYLKINKPRRPTRVFNSVTEAINWLKRI